MKITAIIDSYNTLKYLEEAIQSVLAQNRLPDEFLIVDDGSKDGSADLARELVREVEWATVIEKKNGGQLSCMTEGIIRSTGDILAFLDGDDFWMPHHLEAAEKQFKNNAKLSMYFADFISVGGEHQYCLFSCGALGQTQVVTSVGGAYIGGLNSALVVSAKSVKPYLPLPPEIERDWVVNADNIMIWLTSLSGGQKFAQSEPSMRYRIHPENNFKKLSDYQSKIHRKAASERFFEYCRRVFYIPRDFAKLLPHEYRAHPVKTRRLKKEYLNALRKSSHHLGFWQCLTAKVRIHLSR